MIEILKDELDHFVGVREACRILDMSVQGFSHLKDMWYMENVRYVRMGRWYYLHRGDVERANLHRRAHPERRGRWARVGGTLQDDARMSLTDEQIIEYCERSRADAASIEKAVTHGEPPDHYFDLIREIGKALWATRMMVMAAQVWHAQNGDGPTPWELPYDLVSEEQQVNIEDKVRADMIEWFHGRRSLLDEAADALARFRLYSQHGISAWEGRVEGL